MVKVKLEHTTKTQRRSRGIALFFHGKGKARTYHEDPEGE